MSGQVFFSHRDADPRFTYRRLLALKRSMARFGIDAFVAKHSMPPTDDFIAALEAALRQAHVLVGFMSSGYFESPWTQQEIGYALARDIPVIMVSHIEDPIKPEGFVTLHQTVEVDLTNNYKAASILIDRFLTRTSDHPWLAEAMTSKLGDIYDDGDLSDIMVKLDKVELLDQRTRRALVTLRRDHTLLASRHTASCRRLTSLPTV